MEDGVFRTVWRIGKTKFALRWFHEENLQLIMALVVGFSGTLEALCRMTYLARSSCFRAGNRTYLRL